MSYLLKCSSIYSNESPISTVFFVLALDLDMDFIKIRSIFSLSKIICWSSYLERESLLALAFKMFISSVSSPYPYLSTIFILLGTILVDGLYWVFFYFLGFLYLFFFWKGSSVIWNCSKPASLFFEKSLILMFFINNIKNNLIYWLIIQECH